ncbi:MAG: translation initiation factor IF-3 [Candidatus Yanofskybacteria bacterium RIFCSPHIGHO2_01_FULL_41_21]|uniref:Translation initiation factor IF-3 n=1 Tax=Candidatus Yanofskybacteria bacterium RIFCSPHIGHO2_01_FULL_41_21 TaxID=1802660 RepID=A0A1F8E9T3_9BACT|nr:MAG: translation initiation factor IF-3 [Candidatus Yanofskybacteria bacterium RIFCSPHIGHO2_01_FULL_41_21]
MLYFPDRHDIINSDRNFNTLVKHLQLNNQIRALQVQVIDSEGKQLGVMTIQKALQMARDSDLDLVEVGPNAVPPITKIMDYGKYIYQKERQEKKTGGAKKQRVELKTVRVGFKTGAHDMAFKAKKALEFLEEGHILKLELTLRGREKALAPMGKEKLLQFLTNITVPYTIQEQIKRGPYGWVITIKKDIK